MKFSEMWIKIHGTILQSDRFVHRAAEKNRYTVKKILETLSSINVLVGKAFFIALKNNFNVFANR